MPSIKSMALGLAAFALPLIKADEPQGFQVVWSSTNFDTWGGPTGSETGHSSGFAITDDAGNEWFSTATVNDYVPCISTSGGRSFTLDSTCFSEPRVFHCLADAGGNPKTCDLELTDGNVLALWDGTVDNNWIGISAGQDGSCGGSYSLWEGEYCDANAEWTISDVTNKA